MYLLGHNKRGKVIKFVEGKEFLYFHSLDSIEYSNIVCCRIDIQNIIRYIRIYRLTDDGRSSSVCTLYSRIGPIYGITDIELI